METLEIIKELLENKSWKPLKELLDEMNEQDIAEIFMELEEKELTLIYRLLNKELAAEVFVNMEPEYQEQLIRAFSDSELREVLDELYVDDAVASMLSPALSEMIASISSARLSLSRESRVLLAIMLSLSVIS